MSEQALDIGAEEYADEYQDTQPEDESYGDEGGAGGQDRDVLEAEARQHGWVPRDEYNGPHDKWVDADTFMERGRTLNPILRKENDKLRQKLLEQDKQLKRVQDNAKKVNEFMKLSYERQIEAIKAERRQAVVEGDVETVEALDDQLLELKGKAAEAAPQPVREASRDYMEDWAQRNSWVEEHIGNPKVMRMVQTLRDDYLRENPDATVMDALEHAGDYMSEIMAGKTARGTARQQRNAPAMERGGAAPGAGVPQGKNSVNAMYARLPADARKTCDEWVADGLISKEEYVKSYWEQQ